MEWSGQWLPGPGTEVRPGVFDRVDSLRQEASYAYRWKASERWAWRLGGTWEYRRLDVPDGAYLPENLRGLSAVVGPEWTLNERWSLRLDLRPGFYTDDSQFESDAFNLPALGLATYARSATLQWIFGLYVNPKSNVPVIPGVGARWVPAPRWTALLVFPVPSISYAATDTLDVYAGVAFQDNTYRVKDDFGRERGVPVLDNRYLTVREWRGGPGVRWRFLRGMSLDVSGGMVFRRRYDYLDSGVEFRGDPAPYVQTQVSAGFL